MHRIKRRRPVTPHIRTGGDLMLSTVCLPVGGDEDVTETCRHLTALILAHPVCLGLSANQIGVPLRIIAVRDQHIRNLVTCYVNPKIVYTGIEVQTKPEGCMSWPGKFVPVKRFVMIRVNYAQDMGRTFEGMQARIVQHEIDHLEGQCPLGQVPAMARRGSNRASSEVQSQRSADCSPADHRSTGVLSALQGGYNCCV